jgi:heme-degrading monooxygenase HmoA
VPIKVLIKRRFKKEHIKEINHVIIEARVGAMDQEGYLSSETLRDHQDPLRVVVASNWRSIKNWNNWKNSDSRKSREKKFAKFLDGQTEYEIFDL